MLTTKVGTLRVGEEVSTLEKVDKRKALWGTIEGKMGQIVILTEEEYMLLKKVEEKSMNLMETQKTFKYSPWRKRMASDKLIDASILEVFLLTHGEDEEEEQLKK